MKNPPKTTPNPTKPAHATAPRAHRPVDTTRTAFSLMEMLFVIAIIALLAALIVPNLGNVFGGAQTDTARAQTQQLKNAVEAFRRDMGRLPTEEEGLTALVTMPEDGEGKWQGYLDRRTVPNDPWGTPYRYRRLTDDPQFDFTIISYGSDKQPGGEGDAADINARD